MKVCKDVWIDRLILGTLGLAVINSGAGITLLALFQQPIPEVIPYVLSSTLMLLVGWAGRRLFLEKTTGESDK